MPRPPRQGAPAAHPRMPFPHCGLRADLLAITDRVYRIDSYYILSKYVALPGNYNSAYDWGAGLRFIC